MSKPASTAPDLTFRKARREDLPRLIEMLKEDVLGANREREGTPPDPAYIKAFEAIDRDPAQYLCVVEQVRDDAPEIIGMLQLTVIPGLGLGGMTRGQIEAVRVTESLRGKGYGRAIFAWAITELKARGCGMIQLTSNKQRTDAIRFYKSLGFTNSHEGFKLMV